MVHCWRALWLGLCCVSNGCLCSALPSQGCGRSLACTSDAGASLHAVGVCLVLTCTWRLLLVPWVAIT
jgi:hypothetical protein